VAEIDVVTAISLNPEHAAAFAHGLRSIETRPRPTAYRGRIALHATAKIPRLPRWGRGRPITEQTVPHVVQVLHNRGICYCGHDALKCLRWGLWTLPYGEVVASAVLTDCVPIVENPEQVSGGLAIVDVEDGVHVLTSDSYERTYPGQALFGDFRPGRFALLLDDIATTTARCPACWRTRECPTCDGSGSVPVAGGGQACPSCFVATPPECSVCEDYGCCDPIPERGQQAVPWKWTPGQPAGDRPWRRNR
jgi:hypothetical protein